MARPPSDMMRPPLDARVTDLETVADWLTNELGLLSERLKQATQVEEIIRRAHQRAPGNPASGGR